MKSTNAYAAKRAIIDRFDTLSKVVGHPLEGVQVTDSYPRDLADRSIYGGGARFTQDQESAEPGLLRFETVTTGLYVRVLQAGEVRDVEAALEALGDIVADVLAEDPDLGGEMTFLQIAAGSADFYPTDSGIEAILALSVQVESHLD